MKKIKEITNDLWNKSRYKELKRIVKSLNINWEAIEYSCKFDIETYLIERCKDESSSDEEVKSIYIEESKYLLERSIRKNINYYTRYTEEI